MPGRGRAGLYNRGLLSALAYRRRPEDPMSDSHDTAPHDDGPHEGPIKTPKQLIAAVVASFVVPIVAIILLVNYVDFGAKPAAGSDGLGAEAVALRLQPIGAVAIRDASRRGRAAHRRAGLHRPVRRLPRRRRRRRAQVRRRRRLGAAHQDRLRGAAELGAQGQGRDGRAGRRRVLRLRDRPRRGLHGQPGRRQARRAQGAGGRGFGRQRAEAEPGLTPPACGSPRPPLRGGFFVAAAAAR